MSLFEDALAAGATAVVVNSWMKIDDAGVLRNTIRQALTQFTPKSAEAASSIIADIHRVHSLRGDVAQCERTKRVMTVLVEECKVKGLM